MNALEQLNTLVKYAKMYRVDSINSLKRNSHMNDVNTEDEIDQKIIDAVLTDYINFIGCRHCIDYALYTSDLLPEVKEEI